MKTFRILIFGLFFLLTSVCGLSTTYAAVPHLINYQGRLTDKSGTPVNSTCTLTFTIYDDKTAGVPLWQGTYKNVSVAKGIFSILLGDVNDTGYNFENLAFDKPYWLEIKVGEDVMGPRQQIASVGYAIRAEHGVPKGVIVMWSGNVGDIPSGWALCDGTKGTPDLRNKFIVGAGSAYAVAAVGGEASHVLTVAELPPHTHAYGRPDGGGSWGGSDGDPGSGRFADSTGSAGSGAAHNNLPPYYALAYIMKL